MKKYLLAAALVLAPSFAFAATPNDTVRATLVQQLLAEFVSNVNAIEQMKNTVATAVDPTQFSSLSTLLQTQFIDTQNQLDNLVNPSGMPEQPIQTQAPTAGSAVVASDPCVANPSLTFSAQDMGRTFTQAQAPGDNRHHVQINATYSTGCNLDANTPWLLDLANPSNSDGSSDKYDVGTLGNEQSGTGHYWNLQGPNDDLNVLNVAYFETKSTFGYELPATLVLKVGNITATTTVTQTTQ